MSVEFQVMISEPILVGECVEETPNILARLLGNMPGPLTIEMRDQENGVGFYTVVGRGAANQSFSIAIEEYAVVDISIYNFEDPAFQEEAGTWLVAEVSLRTDLSFVLSLGFAIAVALRTRSTVLDDAGHLKLGRHLDPNEIIDRLRLPVSSTSLSLEEAASLFCKSIDARFGGK